MWRLQKCAIASSFRLLLCFFFYGCLCFLLLLLCLFPAWDACWFPDWEPSPGRCRRAFCLSDKHEKSSCASSNLICHAPMCTVNLFLQWTSRKRKQSQGKKPAASSESGLLCENNRTQEKWEWRESWFAVVDSRINWARVNANDVVHA